jgi:hypothetical protein
MVHKLDGAKAWKATLAESDAPGGLELRLTYRCPTCSRTHVLNLQPLPWTAPHPDELTADTPLGVAAGVDETRRAAGEVAHVEQRQVTVGVWCHWCMRGADVTLSI